MTSYGRTEALDTLRLETNKDLSTVSQSWHIKGLLLLYLKRDPGLPNMALCTFTMGEGGGIVLVLLPLPILSKLTISKMLYMCTLLLIIQTNYF